MTLLYKNMTDNYEHHAAGLTSPATTSTPINMGDANSFGWLALDTVSRAIYIGGDGDLVCWLKNDDENDTATTFSSLVAGTLLPIRVQRISTDTTCTAMVALS